jgi:RHS repeat-associated protein
VTALAYNIQGSSDIIIPETINPLDPVKRSLGEKQYELSNHLGNVLVTVSDRKLAEGTEGSTATGYRSEVLFASDYYPFGMQMPGREFSAEEYRYGFNGMEKDDEFKGEGNSYDFGARMYDARIGRFLSVDPLAAKYISLTPYGYVGNSPISAKEIDGRDFVIVGPKEYRDQVVQVLRDLYNQSPTARKAIMKIISSEKIILISQSAHEDLMAESYSPHGTTQVEGMITFNFESANEDLDASNGANGEPLERNSMTSLAHEIGHALDDLYGVSQHGDKIYDSNRIIEKDGMNDYAKLDGGEPSGVKFENKVRGELGMTMRTHYNGFDVFGKKTSPESKKYIVGGFGFVLENDSYDYSGHTPQMAVSLNISQVFVPGNWWDQVISESDNTNKKGGHKTYGYSSNRFPQPEPSDGETTLTEQ